MAAVAAKVSVCWEEHEAPEGLVKSGLSMWTVQMAGGHMELTWEFECRLDMEFQTAWNV